MRNLVYLIGATSTGGVSTMLPVRDRSWGAVVFQQGRRPIDAELNLAQQLIGEQQRVALKRMFGSGAVGFFTPSVSAFANAINLHSGTVPALLVDGRVIEVGDPDVSNRLTASGDAPPGAGTRDDLVFLEVWYQEIQPGGATEAALNGVTARGGESNNAVSNDLLVVPGTETTRRVQARWRVRVVANVPRTTYPLGMNAPTVLAQGGSFAPIAGRTFVQESDDPGLWVSGSGLLADGQALRSVDGYCYAIPIAFLARSAGVTSIPTSAITWLIRHITALATDTVDGFHASATPTPNTLLALDGNAQIPTSAIPPSINADSVDTFHASVTPTANTLLPLDSTARFPNSVLRTGHNNGLDADSVDTFHASATPTANTLLPLDSTARFPNSVLRMGTGLGMDADTVDGLHANTTPTALTLLPLDSTARFPNSVLRTGHNNGLDADSVDAFHASATPTANTLLPLDASGKYPNSVLRTGHNNGIDADTVDGLHGLALALAGHGHALIGAVINHQAWSWTGSNIGTSYTIVATYSVDVIRDGPHMVSWEVYTTDPDEYSVAIFLDGVQVGNLPTLIDRGPGTRSAGGLINLTVPGGVITVRARATLGGTTISSITGALSLWAAMV